LENRFDDGAGIAGVAKSAPGWAMKPQRGGGPKSSNPLFRESLRGAAATDSPISILFRI